MYTKPTNREFGEIFDSISNHYDSISNHYTIHRRIDLFSQFAKGKCLEVGAGTGEISKALSKDCSATALDISKRMVKELKKKGIKAIVGDAEKLPFKEKSFDTIIGAEMIYYLDNPEVFIKECRRVLKKRGLLLLSSATPISQIYDRLRLLLRLLGFKHMYFDDQNRKFMSYLKIESLLKKEDFKIIKSSKIIFLPFGIFDRLNRVLERTILSRLACFILVAAQKNQDLRKSPA